MSAKCVRFLVGQLVLVTYVLRYVDMLLRKCINRIFTRGFALKVYYISPLTGLLSVYITKDVEYARSMF